MFKLVWISRATWSLSLCSAILDAGGLEDVTYPAVTADAVALRHINIGAMHRQDEEEHAEGGDSGVAGLYCHVAGRSEGRNEDDVHKSSRK